MRSNDESPNSKGSSPAGKSLGMGGEAVESTHAVQQGASGGAAPDPHAASQQNAAATGRGEDAAGTDRAGSEPLERQREHVPSYGGMGGEPRVSSDQREPADPRGSANVGGHGAGAKPDAGHGAPGGQADDSDPAYPTPT